MREVRPTIKVLKSLPRDTYGDATPLDLIANRDYQRLALYNVQHPLLEDARRRFAGGLPDRHTAGSRDQGQPVFEVRDRSGAGWRGAVVLDDSGDPWLVWAERHDRFHKDVSKIALAPLMPSPAEYKIRDREEAGANARDWQRDVLQAFVQSLQEAVRTGGVVIETVPGTSKGSTGTFEVEVDHNEPHDDAAQAHDEVSMLTVSLRIVGGEWTEFHGALTSVCLPFLEPDASRVETVFGKDGSLIVMLDVTHAQLIQLLADPPPYDATAPVAVTEPDRLHYVGVEYILDGYVHGKPLRGVCGVWFVASRSEDCGLPICERCEAEQPAAQVVLDLLRSKQSD